MVTQYKDWIIVAGAAGAVIAGVVLLSRNAEAVDEPAIDTGEILLPDEFPDDAFDTPLDTGWEVTLNLGEDDPIEVVPIKIVGRPEYSIGRLLLPATLEVIGPPGYSVGPTKSYTGSTGGDDSLLRAMDNGDGVVIGSGGDDSLLRAMDNGGVTTVFDGGLLEIIGPPGYGIGSTLTVGGGGGHDPSG